MACSTKMHQRLSSAASASSSRRSAVVTMPFVCSAASVVPARLQYQRVPAFQASAPRDLPLVARAAATEPAAAQQTKPAQKVCIEMVVRCPCLRMWTIGHEHFLGVC
jgi:hypothetical protein